MRHFLIVFDRSLGEVLRAEMLTERDTALRKRFEAEREFSGRSEIEIVVLGAASWAALRKTHARYFDSTPELAKAAASHLRSA